MRLQHGAAQQNETETLKLPCHHAQLAPVIARAIHCHSALAKHLQHETMGHLLNSLHIQTTASQQLLKMGLPDSLKFLNLSAKNEALPDCKHCRAASVWTNFRACLTTNAGAPEQKQAEMI
jgi:hypothetical protein